MSRTYATPAAVIVISVLFPILGLIAVSLRFYTRTKANIRLWIDDWLIVPALMLEFVMAGLMIWGATTQSLGDLLPTPDVPGPEGYLFSDSDQQIRLQQIQYFFDFIGVFAFGLLKLSILFFYRKIFCSAGVTNTKFGHVTMVMIVLVIVWTLAFGIGAIFLCGAHPTFAWAPVAVVAEQCSAQLPFLEGYAISDFIMDVLIWSLPLPKIWALHMTVRRKIAVAGVFLVGLLTIGASAARMAIYIKYIVNAFAQSDGETLITYLLFWTMIECGLGVIVVCLPTLRSLYGKMKMSPGSILSGIKSAFTMRSLQSRSSTQPGTSGFESYVKSAKSSSDHSTSTLRGDDATMHTYIVGAPDLEKQDNLPESGIQVRNEVEQY